MNAPGLLLCYLAAVNLLAFGQMGADKRRARAGLRRVREKTLFRTAALGGSLGACAGMLVFRHKTRHSRFVFGMPALLLLQLAAAALLYLRFR